MINTFCKNCIFSHPAFNDTGSCDFNIIENIGHKNISIKEDYYYIQDYVCQYCLSRNIYEKHKDQFDSVDIKEYIKQQKTIKYYLVVDITEEHNLSDLIESIRSLEVSPSYVSFMIHSENISEEYVISLVRYLEDEDTKSIGCAWKVHSIIRGLGVDESLKTILDTNIKSKDHNSKYLWVMNSYDLVNGHNNNISVIDYLVKIRQDNCSILCSKYSQNIYTVFLNINDYDDLTINVNPSLEEAINVVVQDKKMNIGYYD